MKKGERVLVYAPATAGHGASQFHGKLGTLAYRSNVGKRWFVHLDGDRAGVDVEFMPSELILAPDYPSSVASSPKSPAGS